MCSQSGQAHRSHACARAVKVSLISWRHKLSEATRERAMALLESVWRWLKSWLDYVGYCLEIDVGNHACRPFYLNAVIGVVVIALCFFFWMLWKWWAYRKGVRADWLRELGKDELADLDTQNKYTWDGDKAFNVGDQQEAAGRIRQALDEKAERDRTPPLPPQR